MRDDALSLRFALDGSPLAIAATGAVGLDVLTTARLVLIDPGREANVALAALAAVHPALAVASIALFGGLVVAVTWLDLGWASRIAGTYALASFGVTGTDNLYAWLAGVDGGVLVSPYTGPYIHYGAPTLGVLAGAAWLALDDVSVPWRKVAVGSVLFLVAAAAVPIVF